MTTITPPSNAPKTAGSNANESALQQLSKNTDMFLKMLTTQLQYQDPLQPQDPTQFTQQLVQFTGVEQQIKSNQKLDDLIATIRTSSISEALGYVGKRVETVGDQMELADGKAEFGFDLSKKAASIKAVIVDSTGKTVQTLSVTPGADGETQRVEWDGKRADGSTAPAGVYKFAVQAKDAQGKDIEYRPRTIGTVKSVEHDGGDVALVLGKSRVKLADILAVLRPA
ncbi:MAG TPA: flagellar hook capping FlgD N-terminal domain-containing protein [Azospirillaceae bacterium]|nr:flagellar hook capping FlgD N-terminal domain-containing protein [Azospirillaceae bacterium]